jgi:hypothetical protein
MEARSFISECGDVIVTEREALQELRRACQDAGSQRAWAKAHGYSDAYVSDVLNGRRDISEQLANALGLLRTVTYFPLRKVAA